MRVAALYDIHGNLPALEAVLGDIRHAEVNLIVVGGDVFPGPMANEALACLLDLDMPVQFIRGNGDREVLAQKAGILRSYTHAVRPNGGRGSSGECRQRGNAVWKARRILASAWSRRPAAAYALRRRERR